MPSANTWSVRSESHDGDALRGHVCGGRPHRLQAVLAAAPPGVQAAADAVQLGGDAGQQHQQLPQDDGHRQSQRHHEAGRQEEAVRLLLEGPAPPEQQPVQRGDEQSDVAQGRLDEEQRACVRVSV